MQAAAPHPIDVRVGKRIRARRRDLGISQSRLAAGIGVTFQQLQKYERAGNRVSASRLYEIAWQLQMPVCWFFCEPPTPDKQAMVGSAFTRCEWHKGCAAVPKKG